MWQAAGLSCGGAMGMEAHGSTLRRNIKLATHIDTDRRRPTSEGSINSYEYEINSKAMFASNNLDVC